MMFFTTFFAGLLGLACASPAPQISSRQAEAKLARRQSGPPYTIYNFDQLVCPRT